MKCLALTADVGTSMLVLSLLYTAELPGTNGLVTKDWQLVGILMFVVLLFVFLFSMSLVMVAESLVAVLLFVWMEMIQSWFGVIILAALIAEALPLIPAMRLVERQKEAAVPAVIG